MEAWPYQLVFVHRLGKALAPKLLGQPDAGFFWAGRPARVGHDVKLSADFALLFHDDGLGLCVTAVNQHLCPNCTSWMPTIIIQRSPPGQSYLDS